MSILRELIDIIKAKNEYKRDYRRLQRANIDYAALQNMVDTVASRNVVIDIVTEDGVKLTIRPKEQNSIGYESFQDKFAKARQ